MLELAGMVGESISPLLRLTLVLLQTVSALGLGYFCVRAGYINPAKGEMGGVRFYVGMIGLPLGVFSKLATVNLRGLSWSVVLACNLAKAITYIATFAVTFLAYRSNRTRIERMLTANTFAFFTTASNDLAIGFPVIHAMYGPDIEAYLTANLVIYFVLWQPMAMVVYELGTAWRRQEDTTSLGCTLLTADSSQESGLPSDSTLTVLVKVMKNLLQNMVFALTLLGVAYQVLLGQNGLIAATVTIVDGIAQFPHPLQDIITAWTAPFAFFFLFVNGAAITETSLGFWSALLPLMKVGACSFVGYLLSNALLHRSMDDLKNFCFFYGSIPTGGAPLVMAMLFDPTSVSVVAAAGFWGLVFAGPLELVTAIFLESSGVSRLDVQRVQRTTASISAPCSGLVLMLLFLMRNRPAAATTVGQYGLAVLLYNIVMVWMQTFDLGCSYFWQKVFGFLQMICLLLVIHMQFQVMNSWSGGNWHLLVVAATALVLAFVITTFNTLDFMCEGTSVASYIVIIVFNSILLLVMCFLTVRSLVLKRQRRNQLAQSGFTPSDEPNSSTSAASLRLAGAAGGFPAPLAVLQATRLLMQVINLVLKAAELAQTSGVGFTPMAIVVNVAEHGQGVVLLILLFLNAETSSLLPARVRAVRMSSMDVMEMDEAIIGSFCTDTSEATGAPLSLTERRPSPASEDVER